MVNFICRMAHTHNVYLRSFHHSILQRCTKWKLIRVHKILINQIINRRLINCFICFYCVHTIVYLFICFFFLSCFVSGSDWPLYIGLAVVGAICVALGAGLARGARKGRRLPPYSIARTGNKNYSIHIRCVYTTLFKYRSFFQYIHLAQRATSI